MKRTFTLIIPIFLSFLITQAQTQNCIGPAGQVKWSYWANFLTYPDPSDLSVLENFPSKPDGSWMLGSLKSPVSFTDSYAGMIRGFIKVPQTDNYIFNFASDDKGLFYLSTNQLPANKVKRAEVTSYTGEDEHDKEPGQTSASIQLVGGQYYYFEMYNFEGGGDDHMTLFWKKASTPNAPWLIVDFNYIFEYACGQVCPERGTPCNDSNAATTNDQQDGFCNCVGVAPATNTCVGERALIEAYYYDNIVS